MARFFVPTENIDLEKGEILIKGADCHHLKNVLRKRPGDEVSLCGSDGSTYRSRILSFGKDSAVCGILSVAAGTSEPSVPVILFQGVPKGDKMELIIQKCVELGVNEIVPVMTEHTVVRFADQKDRERKETRWQKISAEAAKQSGRNTVPPVRKITELCEIFGSVPDGWLKIIPYENEETLTLKECLRGAFGQRDDGGDGETPKDGSFAAEFKASAGPEGIAFIIGPEGGFSAEEVKKAVDGGFIPVTLGKRILRTETAGLAVMASIRYETGD